MNKTETKHTPTPWNINYTRFDGAIIGWHISDSKNGSVYPVCRKEVFEDGEIAADSIANAEFIVRAVNSHEALLLVAKKLQKLLSDRDLYVSRTDDLEADKALGKYVSDVYGDLSDAIAQAEGRQP